MAGRLMTPDIFLMPAIAYIAGTKEAAQTLRRVREKDIERYLPDITAMGLSAREMAVLKVDCMMFWPCRTPWQQLRTVCQQK